MVVVFYRTCMEHIGRGGEGVMGRNGAAAAHRPRQAAVTLYIQRHTAIVSFEYWLWRTMWKPNEILYPQSYVNYRLLVLILLIAWPKKQSINNPWQISFAFRISILEACNNGPSSACLWTFFANVLASKQIRSNFAKPESLGC